MDIFNILVRGQWTDQWTPIERSLDMVIVHNVTNVHNGHPQPFLLHFYRFTTIVSKAAEHTA